MLTEQEQLLSDDVAASLQGVIQSLIENFPQLRSVAFVLDWEKHEHNQKLVVGGCGDAVGPLQPGDVGAITGLLSQAGKLQLHLLQLANAQVAETSEELTSLTRQLELARKQINVTRSAQREPQNAEEESQEEAAYDGPSDRVTKRGGPFRDEILGGSPLRRAEAEEEGTWRETAEAEEIDAVKEATP